MTAGRRVEDHVDIRLDFLESVHRVVDHLVRPQTPREIDVCGGSGRDGPSAATAGELDGEDADAPAPEWLRFMGHLGVTADATFSGASR